MKIIIETCEQGEEDTLILRVKQVDATMLKFISDMRFQEEILLGYQDEHIHRMHPEEVYYFESIDNKTYAYRSTDVLEIKQKLYQIEEMFPFSSFIRVSKSCILNLAHLASIHPTLSGRFEATMENQERISISRQYVPALKKKISE